MKGSLVLALVAVACSGGAETGGSTAATSGREGAEPDAAPVSPGIDSATDGAAPERSVDDLLSRYDFGTWSRRMELPGRLDEISGLAFGPDGRLWAHDDERARVYAVDAEDGAVVAHFDLGLAQVRDDFEGMAVVDDRFFLISSRGLLYEFREAPDEGTTDYRVTDTRVGGRCEVEGLDHDPVDRVLLVPCKVSSGASGTVVLHRIPLDPERGVLSPVLIDRSAIAAIGLDPDFEPSAVLAEGGSFLLLSGSREALLEVDRAGEVLGGVSLGPGRHAQPEGLEIGPDGTLYLADEKAGDEPWLTAYAARGNGRP